MLIRHTNLGGSNVEGESAPHQFRYSASKFQMNLAIAVALTLMFCALTWMILSILATYNKAMITLVTGLVFFVFVSAKAIKNYFHKEIILAIQPTGLLDKRWSTDLVTWDSIKEITLNQRENEVYLSVWLWPHGTSKVSSLKEVEVTPDFTIDIDVLDGDPTSIVNLVAQYTPVKPELS